MMKRRNLLFIVSFIALGAAFLLAWRFHDNAYVYVWRLLHDKDITLGQMQFRIPEGPYIWKNGASNRATIYSVADGSDNVVIALHASDGNVQLAKQVALDLCSRVKCESQQGVLNIQNNEIQVTTIRHWMIADQPMTKVFYFADRSKMLVEVDGNEKAFQLHEPTIKALLEQAIR